MQGLCDAVPPIASARPGNAGPGIAAAKRSSAKPGGGIVTQYDARHRHRSPRLCRAGEGKPNQCGPHATARLCPPLRYYAAATPSIKRQCGGPAMTCAAARSTARAQRRLCVSLRHRSGATAKSGQAKRGNPRQRPGETWLPEAMAKHCCADPGDGLACLRDATRRQGKALISITQPRPRPIGVGKASPGHAVPGSAPAMRTGGIVLQSLALRRHCSANPG